MNYLLTILKLRLIDLLTDTDSATPDPVPMAGDPANLPQPYVLGEFRIDPRATNASFKMRLIANNHPNAIIPHAYWWTNDLPDGWEITSSGNINITRAEFNAVSSWYRY